MTYQEKIEFARKEARKMENIIEKLIEKNGHGSYLKKIDASLMQEHKRAS